MKRVCNICKKSLENLKEPKDFLHFSKNNKIFYICMDDLKIISKKLFEILKDPQPYLEHLKWLKKEKILLEEAKKIYKNCKTCFDLKIDLQNIGDKIYDLMCEKCWNKFRKIEKKYK